MEGKFLDHDLMTRLVCVYITAGSLFFAYNHMAELVRKERAGLPDDQDWPPLMESLRKIVFWPAYVWPFRKGR